MLHCVSLFVLGTALLQGGDPPKKGDVTISVPNNLESPQPAGCPIVLVLKLTNVGKEAIGWWSGGPAEYPGAEHFVVEVRYGYGPADKWRTVTATNGQYTQGSGRNRQLSTGESIQVPLAITIENNGIREVDLRIRPRGWNVAKPTETGLLVFKDKDIVDRYRARLIAAAISSENSFNRHLAERYPDKVVIDSLLKMLDTDNLSIVSGIAGVLALQPELPAAASEPLVKALRQTTSIRYGGTCRELLPTALRTQSEAARAAALECLTSPVLHLRAFASSALSGSPGDVTWLRRVRAALADAEKNSQADADVAKRISLDLKLLDGRIQSGDR